MRAISTYLVGRERTAVHRLYASLPIKYDTEDTAPPLEATAAPAHSGSGGGGLIRLIGLMGPIGLIAVIVKVGEGYTGGTRGMG